MRYFVRIRDNPSAKNYLTPLSLHRIGEESDMLVVQRWCNIRKRWIDNVGMILRFSGLGGADDFRQITEPEAKALIRQWTSGEGPRRDDGQTRWDKRREKEMEEAKKSTQEIQHNISGPATKGPTASVIQRIVEESYPDPHCGRPGEVGGSRPREECAPGEGPTEEGYKAGEKFSSGVKTLTDKEIGVQARIIAARRYKEALNTGDITLLEEAREIGIKEWVAIESERVAENIRHIQSERQREYIIEEYNPSEMAYGDTERSPQLVARMRHFSDLFADEDMEIAEVYGVDGDPIWESPGGHDYVIIPDRETRNDRFKDAVFIHNHPSGSSFSPEDIMIAVSLELSEMHAVNSESGGYHMIFDWGAIQEKDPNGYPIERDWYKKALVNEFWMVSSRVKGEWSQKIERGEMRLEEAEHNHWGEVWERFAAQHPTIINYSHSSAEDL